MDILVIVMLIVNGVLLIGVVVATFLYLRRPPGGRYSCEGCGHSITSHLADTGIVAACRHDAGLTSIVNGVCSCRAYLGRHPKTFPVATQISLSNTHSRECSTSTR